MIAPVAIFGIGNRSRGGDAVGPLLLDRLRHWLESRGLAGGFDLLEEYKGQADLQVLYGLLRPLLDEFGSPLE